MKKQEAKEAYLSPLISQPVKYANLYIQTAQ